MKTVYKYQLYNHETMLFMSYSVTKLLTVNLQQGTPQLWVEHNTDIPNAETFRIARFGTGWSIPDNAEYISTTFEGDFVWHWYKL